MGSSPYVQDAWAKLSRRLDGDSFVLVFQAIQDPMEFAELVRNDMARRLNRLQELESVAAPSPRLEQKPNGHVRKARAVVSVADRAATLLLASETGFEPGFVAAVEKMGHRLHAGFMESMSQPYDTITPTAVANRLFDAFTSLAPGEALSSEQLANAGIGVAPADQRLRSALDAGRAFLDSRNLQESGMTRRSEKVPGFGSKRIHWVEQGGR